MNSLLPSPSPTETACLCPDHKHTSELYCHQQYILLFLLPPLDIFTLIQPRIIRTFPFVGLFPGESAIPACTSSQHVHFKRRIPILSANDTNNSRLFYVKCTSYFIHFLCITKERRKEIERYGTYCKSSALCKSTFYLPL